MAKSQNTKKVKTALKRGGTAVLASTIIASGLSLGASPAFAGGGGGGVPGPGGLVSGDFLLYDHFFDKKENGVAVQGYMDASTEWFLRDVGYPNNTGANLIRQACTQALQNAEARGRAETNPPKPNTSRVVGIMWVSKTSDPYLYGTADQDFYYKALNNITNYDQVTTSTASFNVIDAMKRYGAEGIQAGGAQPAAVCIALNDTEPRSNYNLGIDTQHTNNVPTIAGTNQAVTDTITTTSSK